MSAGPPPVPTPAAVADIRGITAEWLTDALRAGGWAATVTGFRPEPVGTGQMAACFRLHLDLEVDPGAEPGSLPSTIVAKLRPEGVDLGPVAAGAYRNEVAFYAELAPTVTVRAPACHHAAYDDGSGAFTLLLEDLHPARQGDQVDGCSLAEAHAAAVNLAGLHGPRWCDPSLVGVAELALIDADGANLLGEVVVSTTAMFCERYGDRLSDADRTTLAESAEAMAAWALGRPERFAPVHGDYRLDNLLFPVAGDGEGPGDPGADAGGVVAVDWQTVSLGLPARDLSFLLGTSLAVDDRRAGEDDLVAAYHAALAAEGVAGYALDQCHDDYRFGLLQGPLIIVTGSIFSTRTDRGDDMFMAMAARACQAVRDHDTLAMV